MAGRTPLDARLQRIAIGMNVAGSSFVFVCDTEVRARYVLTQFRRAVDLTGCGEYVTLDWPGMVVWGVNGATIQFVPRVANPTLVRGTKKLVVLDDPIIRDHFSEAWYEVAKMQSVYWRKGGQDGQG